MNQKPICNFEMHIFLQQPSIQYFLSFLLWYLQKYEWGQKDTHWRWLGDFCHCHHCSHSKRVVSCRHELWSLPRTPSGRRLRRQRLNQLQHLTRAVTGSTIQESSFNSISKEQLNSSARQRTFLAGFSISQRDL